MDANQKTQVIERLRQAQNVLIAVSANPSIDQLAAAIGLALIMNKLGKHTTAVFSGAIPSTLEFLKPETTLEQTTDSLRDFIISLDKSKADKLRYKVEEDVVKIFITPYRTSLSQTDFNFEQGDYNVDVVVSLGVDKPEHIDQAITAHGRILHNATVIGLMAGKGITDVGSINWIDPTASSLCEMIVSISEAFQGGLLDNQMATAFLTGIVANTDRFSNERTTPKVMTMSAQLMAAGANQQLISTKLNLPKEAPQEASIDLQPNKSTSVAKNKQPATTVSIPKTPKPAPQAAAKPKPQAATTEIIPAVQLPPAPGEESPNGAKPNEIKIDDQGTLYHVSELINADNDSTPEINKILDRGPNITPPVQPASYSGYMQEPPQMGGTLTANIQPEDSQPTIDPLSMAPNISPDTTASKPVEDMLMPNQESNPLVANETPTNGGRATIEQSMAKLKESVEAGYQTGDNQVNPLDAETARQKVSEAASADYSQNHFDTFPGVTTTPLEPGQNLPSQDDKPPAVPPPIITPFSPLKSVKTEPTLNNDHPSTPDMPIPPSS